MNTNHQNINGTVLVTGASGRHGGTGPLIVRKLREQNIPVRAMVRRRDERCAELEKLGADVIVADYGDYPSLLAALDGVKHAYFCYPVAAGIVEATARFAAAGRERGLAFVVNNSMGPSHSHSPSPLARAQWLSEQILEWAGFRCAHLRGGFFFENLLLLSEETILKDGLIANAFGSSPITWVASEDMARVCAAALLEPSLQGVVWVTGSETLTFPQVAEIVATGLGRTVKFEDLGTDPERWSARLAENPRTNAAMREHLLALARVLKVRPALPLTDTVRRLTGQEPIKLSEFVSAWRKRVETPTADR